MTLLTMENSLMRLHSILFRLDSISLSETYDPITNIPLDYSAFVTTIDELGNQKDQMIQGK